MLLDRRRFIVTGAIGASALALPAWAQFGRGFTHGVASGEPSQRSVLLWTRHVAAGGDSRLTAEISETPDFARIVAGGSVTASADRDFTAKLVVDGLQPGRWYHYRFVAADGAKSITGRTRTLPDDHVDRFNLGVFSCSNLPFGWFNAYAHAATRRDLDLLLHLGDYIYEYPRGKYPSAEEAVAGRVIEPAGEIVHLADYRLRHASYRADRDLQALHAAFPMIVTWDDHESANDSYAEGAENHDPATEGDWRDRKRASMQAYREWMPVSDADWAEYRIGDLATLFRLETRLTARTRQASMAAALAGGGDPVAALTRFREGEWRDPAHRLLGTDQESWLSDGLKRAAKTTRWQMLAQQINVGFELVPPEAPGWVDPKSPLYPQLQVGLMAAKLGIPHNMDNWNGYPAARSRLLHAALEANAELVVLSGDSHNAWAYDLAEGSTPAGVEFGGHSVTSPGYESYFPKTSPADVAKAVIGSSPELRWADTAQRGYMTVEITPERATAEWLFLRTIRDRSVALSGTHREQVTRGNRMLAKA